MRSKIEDRGFGQGKRKEYQQMLGRWKYMGKQFNHPVFQQQIQFRQSRTTSKVLTGKTWNQIIASYGNSSALALKA